MIYVLLLLLVAAQSNVISDIKVKLYPGLATTFLVNKSPLSFGMPFVRGDVPSGERVALYDAAAGVTHDSQLDCISVYDDGSCRHGVVTALFDAAYVGDTEDKPLLVTRNAAPAPAAKTKAEAVARLQALGVTGNASFTFGTDTFIFDAVAAATSGASTVRLGGHLMTELVVRDFPKHSATGAAHGQIEVQLVVRVYHGGVDYAHFDFHMENERMGFTTGQGVKGYSITRVFASPTYASTVEVGQSTATAANIQHHYGTRWHRQFFWPVFKTDAASLYFATHNREYWSSTRAVPSYDYVNKQAPSDNNINSLHNGWLNSGQLYPLGHGIVTKYMPQTGGRDDIGLLPEWIARWMFKPSSHKLWEIMMHSGDVAGAFEVHWRHLNGDWVDIEVDPLITSNPGAYGHQHLAQWTSPWTPDCAHQPSMAYVPFLATGSLYYEDEMVYWPIWSVAKANPGQPTSYRQQHKGVVQETVRGNAWCWRQMNHAALYLPTAHPMRDVIYRHRNNTLNWWKAQAPLSNPLGYFTVQSGTSQSYKFDPNLSSQVDIYHSPWQHDFLVSVVQHVYELELPSPSVALKALRDTIANWTINRFHSKWDAVWDRSYAAPYHTAQQLYSGAYVQTMQDMWFHSYGGDNTKLIDGLGDSGPVNPTNCGLCYPYGARGTLKLLNASNDVADVTDPATYLSNNLVVGVSAYKWAFAGSRQFHPYMDATGAPTPAPTPASAAASPSSDDVGSDNGDGGGDGGDTGNGQVSGGVSSSSSSTAVWVIVLILLFLIIAGAIVAGVFFFMRRRATLASADGSRRRSSSSMRHGGSGGSKSASRRASNAVSRSRAGSQMYGGGQMYGGFNGGQATASNVFDTTQTSSTMMMRPPPAPRHYGALGGGGGGSGTPGGPPRPMPRPPPQPPTRNW